MSGVAVALSLALAAGTLSAAPMQDEAEDVTGIVQEALAVVGQVTDEHDIEVVESESTTVRAETEGGTFAVTTESAVHAAVVHHADGLQVMAVLEDGATHTTYGLTVPDDVELVESGDGYEFILDEDGIRLSLGEIEAPWAVDANGQQVETSYELVGQNLVQHIEDDVAYPVVVDPRLTFGIGVYLSMWGWEMKAVATAIVAGGGAAAVATCALGKVPSKLVVITKLLCTAVGAPTIATIYRTIVEIWRTGVTSSACYQKRIIGAPSSNPFVKVGSRNCG